MIIPILKFFNRTPIIFSQDNRIIESKSIETLEVDITNQGRLNNLFYKTSGIKHINQNALFDFFDKISGQLRIKNVLLRGMGESLNHPQFFSIVEYFVKRQKSVGIFIFPEEIEKYIKALDLLLPKISLNVYHYPDRNYKSTLLKLSQFKKNIAGHFFIVDNESFPQINTFLEYASENGLAPYFMRVMSKNSPLNSAKKTELENIIKAKNLHRNIFWENGRDFNRQCSYLRGQRMFVNSRGNFSFCHFLPQSEKPEVTLLGIENGVEQIANLYNQFKKIKKTICQKIDYCLDIKNPSPCDYCYRYTTKIVSKQILEMNPVDRRDYPYPLLSQYLPISELDKFVRNLEPDEKLHSKIEVPSYDVTRWCLAVLDEIGYKHDDASLIAWLYNLQLGNTGFSEWPGEMAWCYTTFDVSFAYKYLNLQPPRRDGYINYIKSFQNIDGGYSNLGGASDIYSTIRWTIALSNVGEKNIAKETIDFLRKPVLAGKLNCEDLYYALTILDSAEAIDSEEKKEIFKRIYENLLENADQANVIQKYWLCEGLRLLNPGFKLNSLGISIFINWNTSNPFGIYVAVRLSLLLGIPFDKDFVKKKILAYACKGGFRGNTVTDLYSYAVLKQIIPISSEEKKRFISVIDRRVFKGEQPEGKIIFSKNVKLNYWYAKAYFLMGGKIQINKTKKLMIKKLFQCFEKNNPTDIYYILATFKILGLKFPYVFEGKLKKILQSVWQQKKVMYEIYRRLNCWDIARKNNSSLSLEEAFSCSANDFKSFILSCESSKGGFSHLPGEEVSVQATYHALHSLCILNLPIPHINNHQSFLGKCFFGGGFSGKIGDDIPVGLFTYYAVMSYLLMNSSKEGMKIAEPLLIL